MSCLVLWTISAKGASSLTGFEDQALWHGQSRQEENREVKSEYPTPLLHFDNRFVDNKPSSSKNASALNSIQRPEREPYFLRNPFVITTLGLGGFKPVGAINSRHGPGWFVETNVSFFGTDEKSVGLGLDAKVFESVNRKFVTVPDERRNAWDITGFGQRPQLILVGISAQLLILKSRRFLLTLGFGAGPAFYQLVSADESLPKLVTDEYDRRRVGAAIWQDLRFHVVFGHRTRAVRCGPTVSLSLTESYSFNSDGIQYDTMREDRTVYGIELWPSATACFTCVFGEKPLYPEFDNWPSPRPAYRITRYSLRMDIGMGYSHPVGRISDRHPPGFEVNSYFAFREPKVDAGFFASFAVSQTIPDDVLGPKEDESNPMGQSKWLSSTPFKAALGIAITPFRLLRYNWLLDAGFHAGYQVSSMSRSYATGGDVPQTAFSDYNLIRHGLLFGEHIGATWFFTYSRKSHVGLVLRLVFDQVVSFGESVDTQSLKDEADKKYGIELWPSLTGGISLAY